MSMYSSLQVEGSMVGLLDDGSIVGLHCQCEYSIVGLLDDGSIIGLHIMEV